MPKLGLQFFFIAFESFALDSSSKTLSQADTLLRWL